MSWLQPTILKGNSATLVPLEQSHAEALKVAVQDGELWTLWFTAVPHPDVMEQEISRRLSLQAAGSMLPFTVLNAAGVPIGMTTYMNVDAVHQRVEIGSTWYARQAQRTAVNTECKRLLLTHAFEILDCIAIEFRTSFNNQPSRKAIERLGARLDGILRNHQRHANGTLRDTCVYSIVAYEWPTAKAHLDALLLKY